MTTAPMRRSASNFIAIVTSAVGSIVTTSPRLLAKMFLTIMIASLPVVAGRATIPSFDHDLPQGRFVQERETVQCDNAPLFHRLKKLATGRSRVRNKERLHVCAACQ